MISKTPLEASLRDAGGRVETSVAVPLVSWGWALVVVAAVVYGSLIPFDLAPSLSGASLVGSIEGLRFAVAPLSDRLLNMAIFAPIGIFLVLCRRARGSITRGAIGVVVCGVAISVAVETAQTHVLSRVGSWYDVILNVTGVAIGVWIAIAARLWGPCLSRRASDQLQTRPFSSIATLVAVGFLVYELFPFDFVTSTEAMLAGFRNARWDVLSARSTPIGEPPFGAIVAQLAGAGWFAVLGYLSALAGRERGRSRGASFGLAVKHGILLACLIEGMQLFTGSHVFDVASVILRSLGITFGAWCATFVVDELSDGRWRKRPAVAAPRLLLATTLAVQVTLLAAASLGYGKWTLAHITAGDVSWMPFRSLWEQTPFNAMNAGLSILLWYGSITLVVALLLRRTGVRRSCVSVTAAVFFVAVAVEIIKAGSFGRTPDTTDVVLAVGASIVTCRIWRALIALRRPSLGATQS